MAVPRRAKRKNAAFSTHSPPPAVANHRVPMQAGARGVVADGVAVARRPQRRQFRPGSTGLAKLRRSKSGGGGRMLHGELPGHWAPNNRRQWRRKTFREKALRN